jgi:diaminopimelate epimerase
MLPVKEIEKVEQDYFIETGSPHYVRILEQNENVDIVELGKKIRYSEKYKVQGVNVNTINILQTDKIRVATYERGVEDETLSCGTGVTACALLMMKKNEALNEVFVETKGGSLKVEAKKEGSGFKDIWLSGPAIKVFDGSINV